MDTHADFTASDAPILCLVCTASACGSQLIATLNVRLETPLADVRRLLVSLASGGDGGAVAVREAPTNVTPEQAQRIIASPLHPFDFTETFSFVHGGGCRAYTPAQEERLCVEDVLPRYPRFGVPAASAPTTSAALTSSSAVVASLMRGTAARVSSSSCTQWVAEAAPPVAVVQHPPGHHARHPRDADAAMQHHDGGVSEMSRVAPQKRLALAALFVAPGDRAEGGLRVERVVAERLQLQLPDPQRPLGAVGSGAGLFSAAALTASFGRPFRAETWCAGVTRWNGNTEDLLGRTLLYEAAQVGNEAAVRFLLSQSYIVVDVQERQSGESPLHAAVRGNHPAVVKMLLEEGGANPLLANNSGDTPLHVALQRRRAVLVGMLCSRLRTLKVAPASLEEPAMQNNMGHTPAALFRLYSPSLLDLCRDGASLMAIKALVHHYFFAQGDVTARDAMTGRSVLHAAAAAAGGGGGGSVEVLRYIGEELQLFPALLSTAGTASTTPVAFHRSLLYDFRRQTPLHVAAAAGDPACVQYLLQKLPLRCLSEADINGNTPLLLAMKRRCWRVVELLLAQCPAGTLAASAVDRHGISALHIACQLGMTRVAAVLLKHHGAIVHQNSRTAAVEGSTRWGPHWENRSLVHHAALRGRLQSLEAREATRQEQMRLQQSTGPFAQTSTSPAAAASSTALTVPRLSNNGGNGVVNSYADYSDPVAIARAAAHYAYGGARLGYTPLRCALLHATCDAGSSVIPVDLLRLLCEHGALHEGAAADTRDLLFYLLTHRSDANAEALLAWVMQSCAAAVSVLRRDNVLLCRLCALHDDVGVRWCVEAQMGDVQSRVANPLVACAAAGNAAAAAFLIQCAGADVNAVTGPHSALGVALREGHVAVAQVLIVSRAQLASADGSWTALQQAMEASLESVVRGLLGTHSVDPLVVSRVLTETLQGLLYASPVRKKEQTRLAVHLAQAYDPTRSEVHPTELLHLSAAVGSFDVTRALVDRLVALPSAVWAELLASVPPPPPRPLALIEPTMAPLTIHFPRLLPNRANGKGGLYHPPKPFLRLVVPSVRKDMAMTLLHRVLHRDVYSYAVAAQQVDLVLTLRCGLRLPPWPQPDVRGWTVMDYVMAQAAKTRSPLLALFVAAGAVPTGRHGRRVRPIGDFELVRAVHAAQQQQQQQQRQRAAVDQSKDGSSAAEEGGDGAARVALEVTACTLARLVRSTSERSLPLACDVLDAFLRIHHLSDFHRVPCGWLAPVVRCCAEVGRVDVLRQLKEHYGVDLSQTWEAAADEAQHGAPAQPTPLLLAVQGQHMSVITYLLRAGCAVHTRGCPTSAMAAHIPLKNILASTVTPLALAAWRQDYVVLRQLLAASPPLQPADTEESAGHTVGDALRGLVMGARANASVEQQAALTDCVRALARAGHPLRYASTLRMAVVKGLVEVAKAVVECYGAAALLADLVVAASARADDDGDDDGSEDGETGAVDSNTMVSPLISVYAKPPKHAHLTALAYFAATPRLVPVLRSLLVERTVDEYQLESWRLTSFSAHVQALHQGGSRRGLQLTTAAVDFALRRGCADGAILLMSLGLVGRGVMPAPRPRRTTLSKPRDGTAEGVSRALCCRLAHVLRLWHRRIWWYQSYTVLHSAAELSYGDVIDAVTAEVQGLHLPDSAVTVVGKGAQTGGGASFALSVPVTTATTTAPSLYALAANHADGWTWLPFFERVEQVLDPRSVYVAARDLFALIFSGFGVSHAMDQVCRRAAHHKLLGDMFSVFEASDLSGDGVGRGAGGLPSASLPSGSAPLPPSAPPATRGSAVSAVFVARQLRTQSHALFLAHGTYVLTGMTALTCAVAAGSFDWVQYLSVHGPSLVYHRATAARLSTCADRTADEKESRRLRTTTTGQRRRAWRPKDAATRRPRHRRHQCGAVVDVGAPLSCTREVCRMDALTLCMALLADAVLCRREDGRVERYEEILKFLLAWPAATPRKETINMLAITAATLRRWPLLLAIMQHADRLYAAGLMEETRDESVASSAQRADQPPRYFFPLLPEEIPAVLAHVIGSARHVMHATARAAPKAVLIEVARHCQRTDVESAVDARGCTSVYHALQHRQPFAMETFAALRVPLGRLCRTKQQQTPLMVAAAQGRTALVTSLLRPERVNQQDRSGRTALMLAAAHGHAAAVEVLLAANADVSLADANGQTAVMLAALHGHDELALQLVQNFCRPGDLLSAQTSLLHCAAVGGCWRAAAAAMKLAVPQEIHLMGSRGEAAALLALREDGDGHTPLFLAHAFGSARVLRELLQVLFRLCGDGDVRSLQGLLEAHGGDGAVERRLLRSDSTLERYGWLAAVMEINAALAEKVRHAYAQSPAAANDVRAGEMLYMPVAPPLRGCASLLLWCVQTRNTVGLRALADFNVADDSGALHVAAAKGSRNVVELLVELEMSDPSVPHPQTGRYAFEDAALYDHVECASYLLANTVIDLTGLLEGVMLDDGSAAEKYATAAAAMRGDRAGGDFDKMEDNSDGHLPEGAAASSSSPASVFHVLAGHCGGELLIQFLEQTLRTAARTYMVPPSALGLAAEAAERSGAEVMTKLLYRAMQRPAGASRLTPLEYAVAMGDPAAVLRTAQVLQRLQEVTGTASPTLLRYNALQQVGPAAKTNGIVVANSDRDDERDVLFPAGQGSFMSADADGTAASAAAVFVSASFLRWVPTLSPAVRTVLFDVFGMWDAANVAGFGAPAVSPAPTAAAGPVREVRRLRFGDVRLVGIATLRHDSYCSEIVQRLFNPDHEREVLRLLLQSFPYKIRYEPESYRQCNLALQTQLLQWLGTSLVLGTYDIPAPSGIPTEVWAESAAVAAVPQGDFETIEVQVVRHRSEQYVELTGSALMHSLYLSSAQHGLVVPDVMASLPTALRVHREGWRAELLRLSDKATKLLQRQPHPVLQRSAVTVDWDLLSGVSDAVTSVAADVARYGDVFMQLCEAMRNFCDWVHGPLQSLLREVDAADLNAVVVSVRHGATAGLQVVFRYVAEERAVTQFPSGELGMSAITFKGDVYPTCCIEFNEVTHTDVAYACAATVGRAVAGDVALVRVHHARDHFLAAARAAMRSPRGVAVAQADPSHLSAPAADTAAAAGGAAPPASGTEALNTSTASGAATATGTFLRFKLELEGTTLDRMPVHLLERLLLEEAVSALDYVVSPCPPPPSPSSDKADAKGPANKPQRVAACYDVFHSAAIVSAALVRRLKTVLVLFTTRRDAVVKLSGDKLMLCFTAREIPSRSDIAAEITQTLIQEESEVYRRRLAEVYDRMQQRLSAYLPHARLTVDVDAMARLVPDKAHLLSALRLLVHQQSAWVLQRLVEGVSIGWDTELGAVVRRHVRQVTVMLEPALYGSCYLTPDGVFVYYCPLLCLERQPPGVVTPSSLPSWQLLSAQHIASLLLLQLTALEPQVPQFVDLSRSVACWTAARRIPRRVVPGGRVVVEVQAFNLLHDPLRRGGERLTIMGQVGEPVVKDIGKGRYRVSFHAPRRTGVHRLFLLLHGQPIANSPLWYGVRPGPVDLARTVVADAFDAVVIDVPFTVQLRLHDGAGNRLCAAPRNLTVTTTFPESLVKLQGWSLKGPSVLAVTLRVLPGVASLTALAVPLTLTVVDSDDDDNNNNGGGATAASETITLPPFPCVDKETYQHVCAVRQGVTLDHGSPTTRRAFSSDYPGNDASARPAALQPSNLYFRRSVRRVVKRKLASEAASLGGALGFRYPRTVAVRKLERPSRNAKPAPKRMRAGKPST